MRESDTGFLPNGHGLAAPGTAGPRNFRIVDAWNPDTRVALESKVGAQRLSPRIRGQIDKDAELMLSGDVEEVVWHFFPSATSGKIADDPNLFAYLVEKDVPFEIHLP